MTYSIGDLAQRTGLTVRTLHHYEQLGLLLPSARTDGGYRLYGDADVQTLHRILAYRQIGLPLKEIAALEALVPVDEEIRRKGRQMVEADTGFQQLSGMDAALARFIDAAVAAVKPDAGLPSHPESHAESPVL